MINRLKGRIPRPDEEEPANDYWEVSGDGGCFYVSKETAERILRALERLVPPRRIRFRDVFGSEVWVRTKEISCVEESTRTQRTASRRFQRARKEERKAERPPWEDDDWWLD